MIKLSAIVKRSRVPLIIVICDPVGNTFKVRFFFARVTSTSENGFRKTKNLQFLCRVRVSSPGVVWTFAEIRANGSAIRIICSRSTYTAFEEMRMCDRAYKLRDILNIVTFKFKTLKTQIFPVLFCLVSFIFIRYSTELCKIYLLFLPEYVGRCISTPNNIQVDQNLECYKILIRENTKNAYFTSSGRFKRIPFYVFMKGKNPL